MARFNPKELLAVTANAVISACLTQQGVPAGAAQTIGNAAKSVIQGFSYDPKSPSIHEQLNEAIKSAISVAAVESSLDIDLRYETEILNLFSHEQTTKYLTAENPIEELRTAITSAFADSEDYDAETLPKEFFENIFAEVQREIENNHGLTALRTYVNTTEILRVVQRIENQGKQTTQAADVRGEKPITHNLPSKNPRFIGRDDMLRDISDGLEKEFTVCVVGAGGFGKKQTAIEYAYRHISEYSFIWYFNAESEKQLQNEYVRFAEKHLGYPIMDKPYSDRVKELFFEWLAKQSKYLLIYDNAEGRCDTEGRRDDKWRSVFKNYLPHGSARGHILINSRERLNGIVGKKLEAEVFSEDDAVKFVLKRVLGIENINDAAETDKADAEQLAITVLDRLPLALECAAAYIENRSYTLSEYLNLYNECHIRVLGEYPTATEYDKTILTVWSTTFKTLEKEAKTNDLMKASVQLFRLCTFCAPDDIPLRLFIDGHSEVPQPLSEMLKRNDRVTNDNIIDNLVRYSLVSLRRKDEGRSAFLSVHRLIQEVANYALEQKAEWAGYCLRIAASCSCEYNTQDDFDNFARNLPHFIEITQNAEKYTTSDETKEQLACLCYNIGFGLHEKGEYAKALEWYNKALEIREKVLGKEHQHTALTYNNIAYVYHDQGDYAKALEWYYKALAIYGKVLGEHPSTATMYNNIACVYKAQGGYAKALEWNNKALAIREKVLGAEHPDTATTYNNIAGVYHARGDYAKALTWYNKALAIFKKVLGAENPSTATTCNNIGCVYQDQGDYDKALKWHYKALAIREKVLGAEHPDTAMTYNNIALVYEDQGEYAKALDLFCRAYIIYIRNGLETHPNAEATLDHMYTAYLKSGREPVDLGAWVNARVAEYFDRRG